MKYHVERNIVYIHSIDFLSIVVKWRSPPTTRGYCLVSTPSRTVAARGYTVAAAVALCSRHSVSQTKARSWEARERGAFAGAEHCPSVPAILLHYYWLHYYVATVLARFAYLLPKPAIYVLLALETRQQLLAKFSRLMALCVQGALAAVKSLDFLLIEIPEHYTAVHRREAILCWHSPCTHWERLKAW